MASCYLGWASVFSCSRLNDLCHCDVSWETVALAVIFLIADFYIDVQNPKMVFIMGAVGFTLNILSALFLHGKFGMTVLPLN